MLVARSIAVFLMGLTLAGGPAHAQSDWQNDLASEIGLAEGCKVAFLTHVVERTIDGAKLVMAKVHCEDERVFDASRPDEFKPFTFNACESEATQVC